MLGKVTTKNLFALVLLKAQSLYSFSRIVLKVIRQVFCMFVLWIILDFSFIIHCLCGKECQILQDRVVLRKPHLWLLHLALKSSQDTQCAKKTQTLQQRLRFFKNIALLVTDGYFAKITYDSSKTELDGAAVKSLISQCSVSIVDRV